MLSCSIRFSAPSFWMGGGLESRCVGRVYGADGAVHGTTPSAPYTRPIQGLSRPPYLLTPRCRVLLEKLTGLQLVKKFPAFHGTRRFITVLTSVRHLSLSWAKPIQSTYPHPTSWRSILILSTYLRLGLPSGLFPSGFPTKTLYATLSSLKTTTHPKTRCRKPYAATQHLMLLMMGVCTRNTSS